MEIVIAGQSVELHGEAEDHYFQTVQGQADQLGAFHELCRTLPPKPVIFDVGANIGVVAATAATIRPDAEVVAFEPSPVLWPHLQANTAAFRNVRALHAAVSDRAGSIQFHHATSNAAASFVVTEGNMQGQKIGIEVPAITLDGYVTETAIRPVLIKIDVEGHEPEVLAGAKRLIEVCRPIIYLEFNAWTLMAYGGHNLPAFANALFGMFRVDGFEDATTLLHHVIAGPNCVADLVLTPREGIEVPPLDEMSLSPRELSRITS